MNNKVLLFLADGMRPDFMVNCGNPYVDTLLAESAYTLAGRTVMPSVTLPCHMSLFHSVPPERHGVLTNDWRPQVRPVRGLCEALAGAGKACGLLYDWEPLRDLSRPGNLSFNYFTRSVYEESMLKIRDAAIERVLEDKLDFMFVYFGLTDSLGHRHGFTSEEYRAGMREVWDNLRLIAEALDSRGWSLAVTADHGGHGRSHGDDCPEDMTIPIAFRGGAFRGLDPAKVAGASIMDIAPTIAQAMGARPDPDWEGQVLFR